MRHISKPLFVLCLIALTFAGCKKETQTTTSGIYTEDGIPCDANGDCYANDSRFHRLQNVGADACWETCHALGYSNMGVWVGYEERCYCSNL